MKRLSNLCDPTTLLWGAYLLCIMCIPSTAFGQDEVSLEVRALGIASEEENAFWVRSNTFGRVSAETYGLGILSGSYGRYLGEELRVTAGASGFFRLNQETPSTDLRREYPKFETTQARLDQYYAGIAWKKLELKVGAWQRPELLMGISSIGGDILWSNNALSMPGVVLQTTEPLNIVGRFSIDAAYGNYWAGTNGPVEQRSVDDVKVHFKKFIMNFGIGPNGVFSFGVHHYAQWGGYNNRLNFQNPEGLRDYIRIVLGQEGGSNASGNDQGNKLGNVVGSYRVGYAHKLRNAQLKFYYQSLVEDETGVDGRNFPDGAWGLFFKTKEKALIQGIVYEYINTTWQGGPNQSSGGRDNYFNNLEYYDGWRYQGDIIGLPFFKPMPNGTTLANMVIAHHVGLAGGMGDFSYRLRGSYVRNQGQKASRLPEEEKTLYSGLEVQYGSPDWGTLELHLGADLGNLNPDRFTLGLGYSYKFINN